MKIKIKTNHITNRNGNSFAVGRNCASKQAKKQKRWRIRRKLFIKMKK
jgi:hypothetical protein